MRWPRVQTAVDPKEPACRSLRKPGVAVEMRVQRNFFRRRFCAGWGSAVSAGVGDPGVGRALRRSDTLRVATTDAGPGHGRAAKDHHG